MNPAFPHTWFNRDDSIEQNNSRAFDPSSAQRNDTNLHPTRRVPVLVLLLLASKLVFAHGGVNATDTTSGRIIEFPDTKEYMTLTVDLHTHSVFSDGHVWPKIRVAEALRDGLDALAITEHLEYQPHRADIPHPDRNRAYDDAKAAAQNSKLIVIRGSEITRNAPAGHVNAVFLDDANKLLKVDNPPAALGDVSGYAAAAMQWPAQKAIEAANAQGAFLFWNHPWWTRQQRDGITRINAFHADNAKNGLLHGIEIANGGTYSEEAFQVALDHGLALIGVSDVHDLIDWDYQPHKGGHRPVTLVFTEEKSAAAIQQALFANRTVVWFKNLLIGREEQLLPLLKASLSISSLNYRPQTSVAEVTVSNASDADFDLRYVGDYTFMYSADRIRIPAHDAITLLVKPGGTLDSLVLKFIVENALIAPNEHPNILLRTSR
ncbi:MAG: Sb-PDE family phosphodiesterase [Pseudomonadales bacterium]|nr:Sb-PDE family phosphodiesterase [Pseudomonadales bacterium]